MPTGRREAYKKQAKARPSEALSDQGIKDAMPHDPEAGRFAAVVGNISATLRLRQSTDKHNP